MAACSWRMLASKVVGSQAGTMAGLKPSSSALLPWSRVASVSLAFPPGAAGPAEGVATEPPAGWIVIGAAMAGGFGGWGCARGIVAPDMAIGAASGAAGASSGLGVNRLAMARSRPVVPGRAASAAGAAGDCGAAKGDAAPPNEAVAKEAAGEAGPEAENGDPADEAVAAKGEAAAGAAAEANGDGGAAVEGSAAAKGEAGAGGAAAAKGEGWG